MAEPSIATALRGALADLEGIMPEYDPEHEHSAWETIDYSDLDTLPANLSNAPGISTPDQATAQLGSLQDAIVKHRRRCRKALGMDEVLK